MHAQRFIEQLLALPDPAAQREFLAAHRELLDDQVASALKDQADHLLRADLQRSLETARLLCQVAEWNGNPLHRALGLLAEANARAIGLGEYRDALECYDQAGQIYRSHDCLVDLARSQIGRVWALANLGRSLEALEAGQWASQVLETHGQWRTLAPLLNNLTILYGRMGQDARALALSDQAAAIYRRLGDRDDPVLPLVELNRAILLRNLGDFERSIAANLTAHELVTQLGQTVEAARTQQNLAITYVVLGRYNEALALLNQVRDIFLADGRRRDAMLVELFLSDCLLQIRRFSDVLEKCRRVRELFAGLGTRFEVAQAILNEAVAAAGLGQYAAAMAALQEARELFGAEGNLVWVATTDLEAAAILFRHGRFAESLAEARRSIDVFQAHGHPFKEAQAHLIAGQALAALNQPDQAYQSISAALTLSESRDLPTVMYQCHHLLGVLAAARRDTSEALAHYERAIQELERLRGQLMVEFRAGFLEDKQVVYEDMVALCLELEEPLRALEYAERAKSRALLDLLAYRLDLRVQARQPDDQQLVEALAELQAERNRRYRRLESREPVDEAPAPHDEQSQRQQIMQLERQITEVWHRLLIRNADYAHDAALWHVRTEPILPYLGPESILLEYFVIKRQLVVFLATRDGVELRRLPCDLAHVQRLIHLLWLNFKSAPRQPSSNQAALAVNAQGLLGQLDRLLRAPLHDRLAAYPRLIVVPHGPLHYLPFHALHDGSSFVIERHEVSYLPGASILRYCHAAQSSGTASIVFGHSCGGRLPYAVTEARTIGGILAGQVLLEEEASLTHFHEMARGARVLHLATHGDFRPDNPLFSGLALADGWLTTLSIFHLRLSASLVTLSACQTGRSVVGGGDELLGLMRAFLYAGAASLLVSLWTIEDRSAAQLMQTFYTRLAAGWSKAAALREAQLQYIGQQVDGAAAAPHPYFWASLFLVGDTGPL